MYASFHLYIIVYGNQLRNSRVAQHMLASARKL